MNCIYTFKHLPACKKHSCPSPCLSDGTLDFAAVTRRARMMGATRAPGVGVGVRVVHGAVTVSQRV